MYQEHPEVTMTFFILDNKTARDAGWQQNSWDSLGADSFHPKSFGFKRLV